MGRPLRTLSKGRFPQLVKVKPKSPASSVRFIPGTYLLQLTLSSQTSLERQGFRILLNGLNNIFSQILGNECASVRLFSSMLLGIYVLRVLRRQPSCNPWSQTPLLKTTRILKWDATCTLFLVARVFAFNIVIMTLVTISLRRTLIPLENVAGPESTLVFLTAQWSQALPALGPERLLIFFAPLECCSDESSLRCFGEGSASGSQLGSVTSSCANCITNCSAHLRS